MPITQRTKPLDVRLAIEQEIARRRAALVRRMAYIGEQAVNQMRSAGKYKDQTGNLRSSTGYLVIMDGKVVSESEFQTVKNGADGSKSGKKFAEEVAKQHPTGIVLVVVAGMSYAVYVNAKGLDVIDSGELIAKRLVKNIMKRKM